MEKLDGKDFWDKVDKILTLKQLSVGELSDCLGIARITLYRQRDRHQIPKAEQLSAMQEILGINLLPLKNDKFAEFLPFLEQAPQWKIKAIRQLLGMPEAEAKEQVG